MEGMKTIAFQVDGKKYCRKCWLANFWGTTITFTPVCLAIQIQSEIKNCCVCRKNLLEDKY